MFSSIILLVELYQTPDDLVESFVLASNLGELVPRTAADS